MSSSLQTLTFLKYLRFCGLVFWFRRQRPGASRKHWAATKGKTTSISGYVYSIMLNSAALGSGFACYRLSRTSDLATYTYWLPLLRVDGASKKDEELSSCNYRSWYHHNSKRFDQQKYHFKNKNQSILTWSWGGGFRLWWRHHRNYLWNLGGFSNDDEWWGGRG